MLIIGFTVVSTVFGTVFSTQKSFMFGGSHGGLEIPKKKQIKKNSGRQIEGYYSNMIEIFITQNVLAVKMVMWMQLKDIYIIELAILADNVDETGKERRLSDLQTELGRRWCHSQSRGFVYIKFEMTVSYQNVRQMVGYENLEIRSNVRALEKQHSDCK